MKTFTMAAVAIAVTGLAGVAQADKLDDIIASGTLRCAVVLDFPPMGMRDENNEPIGFDVDYCNDLAKVLGVTAEIVETPFPERIPALMSGRVDVGVASTSDTLERAKTVGFTIPYFAFEMAVTANDGSGITSYEGMKGHTVGAVAGTYEAIALEKQVTEWGDGTFRPYQTQADVFLTENSPAMTVVQNAGLLSPVEQSTLDQVSQQYRPSSGEWVGIAARSTVLIYNPSKISEADLPASMLDLADPKWKGKWGAAPSGADFQAIVSGVLQAEGADRTETWLKGLKENAKVYQNNIATMKAVNAGEVPMGIMYHYYWYRDQALTKEGSANTKLHYFKGEDVGAFVSVSAGGVLKASTKQADAQKFLAWVTSAKGQEALVSSKSMEYAVGEGVASDPALPPLDSLQAPSIDPFTLDGPEVIKLMTAAGIL